MKKTFIKSITGILALSVLCSSVSCGGKSKSETKSQKGDGENSAPTAQDIAQTSYSSIDFDTEIPFEYIDNMILVNDNEILITGGNSDGQSVICSTNTEFSNFNEINPDIEKAENGENYIRTAVGTDGTIYVASTSIDYGDFKMPDYSDPEFDYDSFDFDAMNASAKYSCVLYKMDSSGNILSENEITGMEKYTDEDSGGLYIKNVFPCSDDRTVISINGDSEDIFLLLDSEGKVTGKIDLGDVNWINYTAEDSEGNILCICYDGNGESSIKYVDPDTKKLTDSGISIAEQLNNQNIQSMTVGTGDYLIFVNTSSCLYGVDKDKNVKEVINWIDSDINGDTVRSVTAVPDGDFIAYIRDYDNGRNTFTTLTKRDVADLENTVILTLGVLYSDYGITSKVTAFNKANTGYRIKISDYSKYDEYNNDTGEFSNTAESELKKDIISGNAPDMITVYGNNIISSLASKDIYADLYPFIESDSDISKDDILPNVLSASEYKGKLLSLAPTFTLQTLACKSKFCKTENWTVDDMIETYEKMPEGSQLMSMNTKQSLLGQFVYASHEFIDYEKQKCNFDSDDFLKILEFCNNMPDDSESFDWENSTPDENEKFWNEQEVVYRNDKALVSPLYMHNLRDYAQAKQGQFGEDITLVGYPSSDGKGAVISFDNSFAILDSSESKEGCWEFIKTFFSEDYQSSDSVYNFPVLKTAFEEKADEAMKKPYYTDDDGKKVEYDDTYYILGEEVAIKPVSQKERDMLTEYIYSADAVTSSYSDETGTIISDEANKFFKGECSAEDASKMIQNRLSIMISEQG